MFKKLLLLNKNLLSLNKISKKKLSKFPRCHRKDQIPLKRTVNLPHLTILLKANPPQNLKVTK